MTIDEAKVKQPDYRPNKEVASKLQGKTLLLFVGPAGVGKSTTLDLVHQQNPLFGRTGSIGTRAPEARDQPGFYTQFSETELLEKIEKQELVQYAIFITGNIYATSAAMYKYDNNMLECQPQAVEHFRTLPFEKVATFYVVTEPLAWKTWFDQRYPTQNDERKKRSQEAVQSLEWALKQPQDTLLWIYNTPGYQAETATSIIEMVVSGKPQDDHRDKVVAMLETAKKL